MARRPLSDPGFGAFGVKLTSTIRAEFVEKCLRKKCPEETLQGNPEVPDRCSSLNGSSTPWAIWFQIRRWAEVRLIYVNA
jgi:hypothetical protein